MSTTVPPSQPEKLSSDTESESELDLELNTEESVKLDSINENQKMGDATKNVTEEDLNKSDKLFAEAGKQFSEENYDKAIELLTEAIELNPFAALLFAKRGQVYLKQTKPNACIKDCTRALELNPELSAAFKYRAQAYSLLGDCENFAKNLSKVCNIYFGKQKLKQERKRLEKYERRRLEWERKAREADAKASATRKSNTSLTSKLENLEVVPASADANVNANSASKHEDLKVIAAFADSNVNTSLASKLEDPKVIAPSADPNVFAPFADLLSNPVNQSNSKLRGLLTKLSAKWGEERSFSELPSGEFSEFGEKPEDEEAPPPIQQPHDHKMN